MTPTTEWHGIKVGSIYELDDGWKARSDWDDYVPRAPLIMVVDIVPPPAPEPGDTSGARSRAAVKLLADGKCLVWMSVGARPHAAVHQGRPGVLIDFDQCGGYNDEWSFYKEIV